MAHRGSRRGRGVRTRGGIGSRGGFRGGLARPDLNMFVVLEDQDGGSHSGSASESDSSDNDMLLRGDDFHDVRSQKGKRQRLSSGGRSNQAENGGNVDFDKLSTDGKLTALFSKLSQVDSKVERVVPLVERVKKSEAAIRSHQNRLKLLEYKSIDIESRSRRRNLIFRGIREMPDESNDTCMLEVRRFLRVHLGIDRDMYMERAHRLGKPKLDVTRPIIVAFRDFQDTDSIMNNT